MSRNKKQYVDRYASAIVNDRFGTVFDSMCKSDSYKRLGLGARHFYTLCRVQAQSKEGRACLYKHGEDYDRMYTERDFVFPAAHLKEYGIDRSNAHRYFDELEAAGFIVKKEQNKFMKKVNVYSFSDRWKDSG